MAKIARKHQKIFAGDIPDTNNIAEFGSLSEGTPEYSDDPDDIQSRTAYGQGWANAVINNYAPCLQDLNALFFLVTRQIAYLLQQGISEWSATTSYYIGSLAHDDAGGVYMSMSDTNLNQAFTVAAKWSPILSRKVQTASPGAGDITIDNTDWFIDWTTYIQNPGTQYFILPTPSATNSGREILLKFTGSDYNGTPTIKAADASTLDGAANISMTRYVTRRFISNGTNWIPIN
jgi:hypothetical protein